MSPIFYKAYWHIIGKDVTTTVLNALNSGVVHDLLSPTFISLIPKIKNPKKSQTSDRLAYAMSFTN